MKRKLTNISLVFVSFCIAILLAEIIVRVFWPQNLIYHNDSVWRPDDSLGWRHHENVNQRVNFGRAEVTFRTNDQGFRINASDQLAASDSTMNILVLGDSFMEAVQVESKNTVPKILERQLNQMSQVNTRFHNAGVSGWDPNQYFLESKRILREGRLAVDRVLVFLYEGNDIVVREVEEFPKKDKHNNRPLRMPKNLSKRELTNSLLYPMNNFLEKRSHFFVLIRSGSNKLRTRLGLSSAYFPFVFYKKYQNFSSWETTASICKKMEQAFGQRGIPVDFVLIPTAYHVNPEILEEYLDDFDISTDSVDMQQPTRILGELFRKDSMTLYNPLTHFKRKIESGVSLYGTVDIHLNEAGHKAMADFLMPTLSRKLLQPVKADSLKAN